MSRRPLYLRVMPEPKPESVGPAADVSDDVEELRRLIARHARPDATTAIDGVLLSSSQVSTEPTLATTTSIFAVLARGSKRMAVGDRIYNYGPGQYLVASMDLPMTGQYFNVSPATPALGFGLVLRPTSVASMLLDLPGVGPVDASATPPALGVADAPFELMDAVVRMARLLDRPRDRAVIAPLIEREILWRLLSGPLGATVRQIGLADSNITRMNEAVRRIREHYNESVRVEDLARASDMSTSTFHRTFRAVTGLSPIQFQKQIRLQQSRLLLLTGADDVATVAFRVGYDSASQFSREYRRQFGLPPGRDAARLRGVAV